MARLKKNNSKSLWGDNPPSSSDRSNKKFYEYYKSGLLEEDKITNKGWKSLYEYELEQGYAEPRDLPPNIFDDYGIDEKYRPQMPTLKARNPVTETISEPFTKRNTQIETPSFTPSFDSEPTHRYMQNPIYELNKNTGIDTNFGNLKKQENDPLLMALQNKVLPVSTGQETKDIMSKVNTNKFNNQLKENQQLKMSGESNPYLPDGTINPNAIPQTNNGYDPNKYMNLPDNIPNKEDYEDIRWGKNLPDSPLGIDLGIDPIDQFQLASLNYQLGEEAYKLKKGQANKVNDIQRQIESMIAYNPRLAQTDKNILRSWVKGAIQQTPLLARSAAAGIKGAAKGGATAAGLAFLAGQAGPQVLTPEEIFTVPGAGIVGAKIGAKLGAGEDIGKIESGMSFMEMVEDGVDPETADKISDVVGLINAGLELVQIDTLTKNFPQLKEVLGKLSKEQAETIANKYVSREYKDVFKDYLKNVAKETGQEVAQEYVTMTGTSIGKGQGLSNPLQKENLQRLGQTAVDSVGTFAILSIPSVGMDMYRTNKAIGSQDQVQEQVQVNETGASNFQELDSQLSQQGYIQLSSINSKNPFAEDIYINPQTNDVNIIAYSKGGSYLPQSMYNHGNYENIRQQYANSTGIDIGGDPSIHLTMPVGEKLLEYDDDYANEFKLQAEQDGYNQIKPGIWAKEQNGAIVDVRLQFLFTESPEGSPAFNLQRTDRMNQQPIENRETIKGFLGDEYNINEQPKRANENVQMPTTIEQDLSDSSKASYEEFTNKLSQLDKIEDANISNQFVEKPEIKEILNFFSNIDDNTPKSELANKMNQFNSEYDKHFINNEVQGDISNLDTKGSEVVESEVKPSEKADTGSTDKENLEGISIKELEQSNKIEDAEIKPEPMSTDNLIEEDSNKPIEKPQEVDTDDMNTEDSEVVSGDKKPSVKGNEEGTSKIDDDNITTVTSTLDNGYEYEVTTPIKVGNFRIEDRVKVNSSKSGSTGTIKYFYDDKTALVEMDGDPKRKVHYSLTLLDKLEDNINPEHIKPITKVEEKVTENIGYHAGDLGKAESYFNIASGNRSTGHFGTGTYFVGDKKAIDLDSYNDRPQHKISFEGYNLFKPKTYNEAKDLHDDLKFINYNSDLTNLLRMIENEEVIDELNKWDDLYDEIEKGISEERKAEIIKDAENSPLLLEKDLKNSENKSNGDFKEYFGWIVSYMNGNVNNWDGYVKNLEYDYMDFKNSISKILDIKIDKALSLMEEINNEVKEELGNDWFFGDKAQKADSISTRFMKKLGYEGIDVRHIKEFDNTKYGSVIYDLKDITTPKETVSNTKSEEVNEQFKKGDSSPSENSNIISIKGKKDTIIDNKGNEIEVEYRIVDANDLIASHTISLHKNEQYPKELQPRDRSRKTSMLQVDNIMNNLNPEWLGESKKISDGSPIVGEDYVVESGNGRTIALQKMYETNNKSAEKYINWLNENKEKLGFKEELPNNPILVRVRLSDVDRIKFTRDANVSDVSSLNSVEQAKVDSEKLEDFVLNKFNPNDNGVINTRENKNFIASFFDNVVPKTEHGKYFTDKGKITQEGILRIRNAMFYKAYQDENLLSLIAEQTDNNIKTITNTMLNIVPRLVNIKYQIDKELIQNLDFSNDIRDSVNQYIRLKNEGKSSDMFLNEISMFGDSISNESKDILIVLEQYNRSTNKLMKYFNFIFEGIGMMAQSPNQVSLLGDTKATKGDIIDYASRRFNLSEQGNVEGQADLFQEQQADSSETTKTTETERIETEGKEKLVDGDKVTYTSNGKDITGTIQTIDYDYGEATINVDQIADTTVPIKRKEYVSIDKLTKLEEQKEVKKPTEKQPLSTESNTTLYHGSYISDLTSLQNGTWFSPVKEFADKFAEGRAKRKKGSKATTYSIDIDLNKLNLLDISEVGMEEAVSWKQLAYLLKASVDEIKEAFKDTAIGTTSNDGIMAIRWIFGEDETMIDYLKSKGYDGIKAKEGLKSPTDYVTTYKLFNEVDLSTQSISQEDNKNATVEPAEATNIKLSDYGIEIIDTETKKGTKVWNIKGNTFPYKEVFGRNGMKANPYGRGKNFVWSFKKSQYPTREELENAILEKLPPIDKPIEEVKPDTQSINQTTDKNTAQDQPRSTNDKQHDYSKDYFIVDVIESVRSNLYDIADELQVEDIRDSLINMGYISGLENNLVQQKFVRNAINQELMSDGLTDDFYNILVDEIRRRNNKEGVEPSGPSENEIRGTKTRDTSSESGDIKTSEGDKPRQSTSTEIQTTQGNGDDDIQYGNELVGINQDEDGRTDRDDSVDVPRNEENGIPEDVITDTISKPERKRNNLKINVEDDWLQNTFNNKGQYTTTKLRKEMNAKALEILDKPSNEITEEDKKILQNYTGKGGLGESGKEILTQYFTDYKTVDTMYKKIEQMGFSLDNIRALDPSTGVGVFMGLAPDGVKFDAIDIDPIVAQISTILYPDSKVMTKGFEEHRANNEYDLVISNVPFLDARGSGIVKDKPNIRNLHDYFVLASLDKAKDNGLVALITPSSVMDAIDPKVRGVINKDAEFLGAYRLPAGVFDKTGTDAITDIIFLRRRVRNSMDENVEFANNELFLKTSMVGKEDLHLTWETDVKKNDLIPINSYYKEHSENLLGTLSADKNRYGQNVIKIQGKLDNTQINKILNDDIVYEKSPYKADKTGVTISSTSAIYFESIDADITPIGGIFEKDGKWYIRSQIKGKDKVITDKGQEVVLDKEEIKTTRSLLDVASLSQSLRVSARNNVADKELKKITNDLYKKVEDFRAKHLPKFENTAYRQKLSTDPRYYIVKVLLDNPDIFNKDTLKIQDYQIDLKDKNNLDILSQHLVYKYGEITLENFAENYQGGISIGKAKSLLDSSDLFYKQPSVIEIETFDNLSNVEIETVQSTPNSYVRSIDYLSGNIYKKIELVEREIKNGNKEYQKNLDALKKIIPEKKTLNVIKLSVKQKWIDPSVIEDFLKNHLDIEEVSVKLNELNQFEIKLSDYGNPKANKLSIDKFSFYDWFPKYMNGQSLNIMVDGKKDKIASSKVTAQMRKIDDIFNQYLKANPDTSNALLEKYNYIFNNYVEREKENIIIPSKNKDWKFRGNQIEFINMALSVGTGVNAQRTGAGKTATNVAVNHMLKVTGRANKPAAIVPGKVIKKFVRDVKEGSRGLPSIFPDMKILDVTDYSFNEAMARIAFNEWDLILIPDTWFKRISMTPEREMVYIQKQIDDLKLSEAKRATVKGSKRSQKAFEKALEALEEKYAELMNYVKNDGIYFEDLGIDALSLDEAQSVKNLVTSVRGQDLGMSATPSQTAIDFNMKAKYIMEMKNGKNIFLYTATPVSNSILEIYGLLQNIAPQEWVSRGIYTVEDFIEAYCDTSETIGITKENEVGVINKVDGFVNIDDLRGLFKKYVDYRPFIEGAIIPGLKEQRYVIPMAESQRPFFNDLLERLNAIKASEPRIFEDEYGTEVLDNVMKVLGDARRGSTSMSLITGKIPTYNNSPKIAKGIEIISKIYKETGKNQVIFLDQYGDSILGKNNLHNFLKQELGKKGVPLKEIVIVNGKINSKVEDKLKIQDDFNDGKYKIIIGTTESIGAGMDLQEKTISILNLDIPWTPTSVTQRKGRGERPGNEHKLIANIDIFIKGSYDAWSTNIVGVKKKWQDQLLEGSGDSDSGYLKNQDADNYDIDSIISELIEDPTEKAKLNFEVTRRKKMVEIASIKDNIAKEKNNIEAIDKSITDRKQKIERYKKDLGSENRSKLATLRIEQHETAIKSLEEELEEAYGILERHETQLLVETDSYDDFISRKEEILNVAKAAPKKDAKVEENTIESLIEELKKENKIKARRTKNSKATTRASIPVAEKTIKPTGRKSETVKGIQEIIEEIRKDFHTSTSTKRFRGKRGEVGQFDTHSKGIKVRKANDMPTISHELGHFLDDKYGFSEVYENLLGKMADKLPLSEEYSKEELPGEALAEFVRLYLMSDDKAQELSQDFYDMFVKELDKTDLKNLNKHRENILNHYGSELTARSQSTIHSHTEKKKTPMKIALEKAVMNVFDDLEPIRRLAKLAETVLNEKLQYSENPYVLAMYTRMSGMIARAQILEAQSNPEGEIIGKSFTETIQGIKKDEKLAFDDYLKVSHAITLWEYGKQVYSNDYTLEDLELMKSTYERDHLQFKEVAQNVYDWWTTFIEEWVVNQGLLDRGVWEELKAKYPTYVPNFRVLDNSSSSTTRTKKGFGNQHTPIKKMKGSDLDTYSVIESIMLYTDKIVKTQKRNEVGVAIHELYNKTEGLAEYLTKITHETQLNKYDARGLKDTLLDNLLTAYLDTLSKEDKVLAEGFMEEGDYEGLLTFLSSKGFIGAEVIDNTIDDVITYFTPRMFSTDNSVYTVIDKKGKTHFYEVHDPLFLEAMLNLNDKEMDKVTRFIGSIKRVMTNLTTGANPIFGLTSNIWGDVPEAFAYGSYKNPFEFGVGLANAMKDVVTSSDKTTKYKTMGGGLSSPISENRKLMAEMLNEIFPDMKKSSVKSMLEYGMSKIEQFNDTIETAPRLTEFNRLIREYGNTYEGRLRAIYEANEVTTNFLRRGKIQRTIIGQGVPFLNAGLQGLYKLQNTRDPKKAKSIVLKSLIAITMFEAISMSAYKDDEDYEKLSDFIKDNYWLIKYTDGKFLRVKKPRVLGMVFGTMFRRGYKSVFEGEEGSWDNFSETFMNVVLPPTDTIVAPIISTMTNKSWSGSPVVSLRLQGLTPIEQYDTNTSEVAKGVSKVINSTFGKELSPKNIDYLIQQYTGIIGQVVIPSTAKGKSLGSSFKQKVTTDVAYSNDVVNEYYEAKEKLDTAYTTYNATGKMSKDFDPVARYRYNQVNKEVSYLWKEINSIKENPKYSLKEKQEKEREVRLEIMELTKPENLVPTTYDEFKVLYNRGQDLTSKFKEEYETTKIRPEYTDTELKILELYNIPVDKSGRGELGAVNYQLTQIDKRRKQLSQSNVSESKKKSVTKQLDDAEQKLTDKYMKRYNDTVGIDIKEYFD